MLPLNEAICQSGNLSSAYARYQRYRGIWAPGIPMRAVTESPVLPMLKLVEELRNGSYRPYRPHTIRIAKANGELRELSVFAIRDRVAQRAVLQVLQARTEGNMSPCSYGYRPGHNVAGAVAHVQRFLNTGFSWVVDADIERCFDSIPRMPLLDEVARRLDDPTAAEWVARVLGWGTADLREGIGIPQGSVLGPWLCNVYLWQLDDAMREIAMVRFADDFVLLTISRYLAETLQKYCANIVSNIHLRLHPIKTTIVDGSIPFRFLGQWLSTMSFLPSIPLPVGSQ